MTRTASSQLRQHGELLAVLAVLLLGGGCGVYGGVPTPSLSQMCTALTNQTVCGRGDDTKPSWCAHRNPYLVPRFLTATDALALDGELVKGSDPICDDDSCYMFTRFMGAEATNSEGERRKIFVINVATEQPDTNQLVVLQADTLHRWKGWKPTFQDGTRWGDAALATVDGGRSPSLVGASSTGNPFKWYKNIWPASEMVVHFAQRFATAVVRRPTYIDAHDTQQWITTTYFSPTSDFISISGTEDNYGTPTHTQSAGWWIWHRGKPIYASLTKHRYFEIYRLLFMPSGQTNDDPVESSHIWEIDREPVSMQWAQAHCTLDLDVLREEIFQSPECKNSVFPGSVAFLKSCPDECRAQYAKYLSDRRCVKALYDKLKKTEQPNSLFLRGLSQGQKLCRVGNLSPDEKRQKKMRVSFLEHSFGCKRGFCGSGSNQTGTKVYPSQDISGTADCQGRNRTIVMLTTPDSISALEYVPPGDPRDGPARYTMTKCSGWYNPKDNSTCYPFSKNDGGTCYPPCFVRYSNVGNVGYDDYLLSLNGRVRRIDIEKEHVGEQDKICGSCSPSGSQTVDDDACVYRPTKIFEVVQGTEISDATLFSSQTAPEVKPESREKLPRASLTQQVWAVVALRDVKTNVSSFQGFEVFQFGNMTRHEQGRTRACNPVGSLKGGDIPVHSTPVTMAASFSWEHMHGSRLYNTEINQVVHAWQPRIDEIDNLIESANCTCASWDTSCLIREATLAKINGGGSGKVDPAQLRSLASMKSLPEGMTHVIHASTEDRRLAVLYLHEVPRKCHAASEAAAAHRPGYFYEDNGNRLISSDYGGSGGMNELIGKIVNEVPLAGVAQHIELTDNAQFAFITMTRLRREVDSMDRAALMCKLLRERPGDPALLPYTVPCARTGVAKVRPPNILDFVQVATLCMPGSLCPNFSGKASLVKIANGNYSQYGFEQLPCEPRTFCAQGVRQDCPIGFKCPNSGMITPEPCKIDKLKSRSCYASGLMEEMQCPKGTVCYTPYMPGLPAPPGFKAITVPAPGPADPGRPGKRELLPCTRGEFCSLGRDQSEGYDALLCPGGTMCPNASVPVPINCTTPDTKCIMKLCPKNQSCVQECRGMYSCPNGTVQEQLCPAGKTCHTPLSAGRLCPKTSFCPNGTFAAPPPCPPKFFCPTPSEKLPCPEGHFCPGGTLSPLKCAVMDFCPASSSKKQTGVYYLVIVFALPFLCCGGLKWAYKLRDSNRTKRDRRKELKRLSSLRGSLSRSQHNRQSSDVELSSSAGSSSASKQDVISALVDDDGLGSQAKTLQDALLSDSSAGSISAAEFEYMMQIDEDEDEDLFANQDVFAPRKFRVDFEFRNLGLKLKSSGRSVLDGVTGRIKSAHITAVMGPSGAGKSTFVTTLAGKSYYGDTVGQILINGEERPLSDFKRVVGFVPQEDIMMRDLTVKENIWFSAQTRLPTNWTTKRKKRYRDATIEVLGLREIRHSPIGDENTRGISGGQRKRVNIALEMVADPLVLFLDEPTSGLDSTSSMEVCSALRKIADIGITVVTVLHQPRYEIFTQFHDVLLLGKGGRAVYLGPSEHALPYFEHHRFFCPDKVNPPDFMMDVIGGDGGDERFHEMHPNFDPKILFKLWTDHQAKQRIAEEQGTTSDFDEYLTCLADDQETCNLPTKEAVRRQPESKRPEEPTLSERQNENEAAAGVDVASLQLPEHDPSLEQQITSRQQASGCHLVWRFFKRSLVQITRHWMDVAIDNGLLFLAAGFMSYINLMVKWVELPPALPLDCYESMESLENMTSCGLYAQGGRQAMFGAGNSILTRCQMTVMAVGLCTCASSIKVFGRERIVYWREAAGLAQPVHSMAYFVGKDLAVLPQQILGPLLYAIIFTAMSANLGDFGSLYLALFGVTFVAYSIGYLVSISVPASLSQLVGVVVIFCMSAFDGALPTIPTLEKSLFPLNYGFWHLSFLTPALRALYVNEAVKWVNVAKSAQLDIDKFSWDNLRFGTFDEEYRPAVLTLFAWGLGFRLAGMVLMAVKDRNKKL